MARGPRGCLLKVSFINGPVIIVDRTKGRLLCSGNNVYPRVLEELDDQRGKGW